MGKQINYYDELLEFLADHDPQCSNGDASCITLKNTAGKELHIIFEDEITVFYDVWHKHYRQDEFEALRQDVRRILHNERYIVSVFLQDNWIGAMILDEPLTKADIKRQIERFLKDDKKGSQQAKEYGVEARMIYWDEAKNQTLVFCGDR